MQRNPIFYISLIFGSGRLFGFIFPLWVNCSGFFSPLTFPAECSYTNCISLMSFISAAPQQWLKLKLFQWCKSAIKQHRCRQRWKNETPKISTRNNWSLKDIIIFGLDCRLQCFIVHPIKLIRFNLQSSELELLHSDDDGDAFVRHTYE